MLFPRSPHLHILVLPLSLAIVGCGSVGLDMDSYQGGSRDSSLTGLGGAESNGGSSSSAGGSLHTGSGGALDCGADCVESVLLFADHGFESGIPPTPWTTDGGEISRNKEVVYSGDYSLVTSQGEPGSEAEMREQLSEPTQGDLYFRSWIYVPEGSVTDWLRILAFNSSRGVKVELRLVQGEVLEISTEEAQDAENSSSGVVPLDQWVCLQSKISQDDSNGLMTVAINGEEVVKYSGDTLPEDGVETIVYGIGEAGPNQYGATLYWDDVLLGPEPIPCGQASQ